MPRQKKSTLGRYIDELIEAMEEFETHGGECVPCSCGGPDYELCSQGRQIRAVAEAKWMLIKAESDELSRLDYSRIGFVLHLEFRR